MSMPTLVVATPHAIAARQALLPFTIAALFLSAALLFAVQPMFTRMVLPVLGGSPSVWSLAMVLFQGVLLAGYAYAHALSTHLSVSRALIVHLCVMILAVLCLPVALPGAILPPSSEGSILWFALIFAQGVAVPFFAIAGNGPLLQAWFARSGHRDSDDPYHLYAASNIGSFAGLLSYPFLIEPNFGLGAQSALWSLGFALLAATIVLAGVCAGSGEKPHMLSREVRSTARLPAQWWKWIVLSFTPSALLVAVTAHISSDIAAAPLLWVIPLALFLATFVIAFRKTQLIATATLNRLQLAAIGTVILVRSFSLTLDITLSVVLDLTVLFIAALTAHQALVQTRPDKDGLTLFYLSMSLGGVLGGVFTALVAPRLFSTVAEFPITLVLCLVTPLVLSPLGLRETVRGLAFGAVLGLLVIASLYAFPDFSGARREPVLVAGLLVCVAVFVVLRRQAIAGLAMALVLFAGEAWLSPFIGRAESVRSFFGVHRIALSPDGRFRLLFHGTTLHGARQIADNEHRPVSGTPPTMYYHPDSPFADAISSVGQRKPRFDASIVGLGAGALAWYAPGRGEWRYFEIDPHVVDIALNRRFFGFMSDNDRAKITLGDARLTLGALADHSQDLIVLDAFSSDSIPGHLLTVEAMQLYTQKLAPGGLLLMHVSNRNLELASVVAANARQLALAGVRRKSQTEDFEATYRASADVIVLARDGRVLDDLLRRREWVVLSGHSDVRPWSDDFSDLAAAIYRRLWLKL